jgi:hypothetical protein
LSAALLDQRDLGRALGVDRLLQKERRLAAIASHARRESLATERAGWIRARQRISDAAMLPSPLTRS